MISPETDFDSDEFVMQQWEDEVIKRGKPSPFNENNNFFPTSYKGNVETVLMPGKKPENNCEFITLKRYSESLSQDNKGLLQKYIDSNAPSLVWENANNPMYSKTNLPQIAKASGTAFEWLTYLVISQLEILANRKTTVLNPTDSHLLINSTTSNINPDGILIRKVDQISIIEGILEYKLNPNNEASHIELEGQIERMIKFSLNEKDKRVTNRQLPRRAPERDVFIGSPLKIILCVPQDRQLDIKGEGIHVIKTPFDSEFVSNVAHYTLSDMNDKNQRKIA